jgi:hypothetical protein
MISIVVNSSSSVFIPLKKDFEFESRKYSILSLRELYLLLEQLGSIKLVRV